MTKIASKVTDCAIFWSMNIALLMVGIRFILAIVVILAIFILDVIVWRCFCRQEQESWLQYCEEIITTNFKRTRKL